MNKISAVVEKIRYHDDKNGYTIMEAKCNNEIISILGNCSIVGVGADVVCEGMWRNDHIYGKEFRANKIELVVPTEKDKILQYLSSNRIKGIGPATAKRIVDEFGEDTYTIFDKHPEQLLRIKGIGINALEKIIYSWTNSTKWKKIYDTLISLGLSDAMAAKIYNHYGEKIVDILQNNPYQIIGRFNGLYFYIIDKWALKNGTAKDNPDRIKAGIKDAIKKNSELGNTASLKTVVIENAKKILDLEENIILDALSDGCSQGFFYEIKTEGEPLLANEQNFISERVIATKIKEIQKHKISKIIQKDINIEDLKLSEEQLSAVEGIAKEKFSILTGGPGVGKTTVIKSILSMFNDNKLKVALCAPTGRAANRMAETTGQNALTIHRLLEYNAGTSKFERDSFNLLDCEVLIVDEVSMVDSSLMSHLISAVKNSTIVLLVGDHNQLPSIGPGAVLKDLISATWIPKFYLTKIFRQGDDSKIITNAHKINNGEMIDINNSINSDFFYIKRSSEINVKNGVIQAVDRAINGLGIPAENVQILSAVHKGESGTIQLNREIQKVLNPKGHAIHFGGDVYRVGDRVIQMENNYDLMVFNGDMGYIKDISGQSILIDFNQREIILEKSEINQIKLAYAISIHKSQGSEFDCVIIPLTKGSSHMIDRGLLYTAVTRGKKYVIIIGDERTIDGKPWAAITDGINNVKAQDRTTCLQHLIQQI